MPNTPTASQEAPAVIRALRERETLLESALEKIIALPGEINPSNYDHDDVCYLNAQFIEAYQIARVALKGDGDA